MTTYDLTEPNPGRAIYVRALEQALLDIDLAIEHLRQTEPKGTKDSSPEETRTAMIVHDAQWLDAWETRRELCRDLAKLKPLGSGLTEEVVISALELAAANRRNSGDANGGDVRYYAEANALLRYASELEEGS